MPNQILIVGGYGEVGRRIAADLEQSYPSAVLVGGRNPERAPDLRTRRIDVDDPASVEAALDGVGVVVACVRQPQQHLLHAVARRGLAYTSIAPPWLPWPDVQVLHEDAKRSGARLVLAAGLEPGISSVLARVGADRLGAVDTIETALLLSAGDSYGPDSMAFLVGEIIESYEIMVDGRSQSAHAFGQSKQVEFPAPIGQRRAYTMPFRDQLYYPATLGARTAIARLALDPPWLGKVIAMVTRAGGRALARRRGSRDRMHRLGEKLRQRYSDLNRYALIVEVRTGERVVRSTLVGQRQSVATAIGAAAIASALRDDQIPPGAWLAEQVIEPTRFLARLAARGLNPVTEEMSTMPPHAAHRRSADLAGPAQQPPSRA